MEYCKICGLPLKNALFCADPECIETRLIEYNSKSEVLNSQIKKFKEDNDKNFKKLFTKIKENE